MDVEKRIPYVNTLRLQPPPKNGGSDRTDGRIRANNPKKRNRCVKKACGGLIAMTL
jgi:hypothetical protein